MEEDTLNEKPITLAVSPVRSDLLSPGKRWMPPRQAGAATWPHVGRRRSLTKILARLKSAANLGAIFRHAVLRLDACLRRQQNIFEFCDSRECLLRVALRRARHGVVLPSGMQLRQGELMVELHIWNEQIPRILDAGPDLSWAVLTQRRLRQSLTALAREVECDPRFNGVQLLCAETRLGSGRPRARMERFADFFGFELIDATRAPGWRTRLIDLGERLHLWALIRTFNPGALTGRRLRQSQRHQLWMSRKVLLAKYRSATSASDRRSDLRKRPSNRAPAPAGEI
jgi:hypothetical protein